MSWWPYQFIDLSHEEKLLRRDALDFYASIAHYSGLAPILVGLLFRVYRHFTNSSSPSSSSSSPSSSSTHDEASASVVTDNDRQQQQQQQQQQATPSSPRAKKKRLGATGTATVRWRRWTWWLGDDVRLFGVYRGQRDQWILGLGWMMWLLLLCALGTGDDYLHLTKRFGIVAASQMPIQYLLSLKSLNPYAFAFSSGHEVLNKYHRVLGVVIYNLLLLHFIFYNYFLLAAGVWLKRIFSPIVFCGVAASFALHALNVTSLSAVRKWSYRVFFILHLTTVLGIPPLIFFHAPSARLYIVEAFAAIVLDILNRKHRLVMESYCSFDRIPGTDLIKFSAEIPKHRLRDFKARPASHIYLSVPPHSRPKTPAALLFEAMFNPFTVASVEQNSNRITLVARQGRGPMTSYLGNLASTQGHAQLHVDGPHGAAGKRLANLIASREVDRYLLFAGGVGATFIVPVYRAVHNSKSAASVRLVWAVRGAAEGTWATTATNADGKTMLEDGDVDIYLTGGMDDSLASDRTDADEDITALEMAPMYRPAEQQQQQVRTSRASHSGKRPDIVKIVNDTFRQGREETVAVFVCGPDEMARDVKRAVRPWAMEGRRVIWHNEGFGW